MASILPFTTDRRRRVRHPLPQDAARGQIVIFSGVRIERVPDPQPTPKNAPAKAGG